MHIAARRPWQGGTCLYVKSALVGKCAEGMHAYVYACTYVCIHVRTRMSSPDDVPSAHAYMHTYICIWLRACVHVCMPSPMLCPWPMSLAR